MKFKQLREKYRSKYPASLVAAAVKIAIDMGGNMTGAYKKIEAMKRGLADDPIVKDALKQANESVNEELGEVRPFKKGWSPAEWRIVRKDKKIEKDIEKFYKSMGGKYGDPRKAMTVKQAEKNIPYLYKHVVSNFGVVNNTSLANAIMKFYDHWDDGKGVYKYESVNEDYAQDLDLAQKNMARLAKKEKGQDKKDYEAVARALNQGNLGAVKKVIKGISTKEIQADLLNILVGYNDLIAKMYPKAVDNKGNLKSGLSVDKMIKEDTVEEATLAQLKRKHKRHIDNFNKRNKDLPSNVEKDLMKYAMDNDGVGDDPDDFDDWLVQNIEEVVSPEEKAQLALKHAKELETLKKKHEREKENMKEDTIAEAKVSFYGSEIKGLIDPKNRVNKWTAKPVDYKGKLGYKITNQFGDFETLDLKAFARKFG